MAKAMQPQKMRFSQAIQTPMYKSLVNNTLGDPARGARFIANITSAVAVNPALQECNPGTILAGALLGESLLLQPSPQLGQFYLVPFKSKAKRDRQGNVIEPASVKAQFVLGYKGYIQLAMRTGQYRTINADVVYEGEVRKVNKLTGEIAFDGEKTSDKIIGYFCYFELLNGFSKTLYVTVEDMAAYAKRYSPSVKKETTVAQLIAKANDGIIGKKVGWEGNFNDMALKTVIRRLLSKYGYLSVEMQNAMAHDVEDEAMSNRNDTLDNAAAQTVDLSATEYEEVDTETGEVKETGSEQAAPAPAPEY